MGFSVVRGLQALALIGFGAELALGAVLVGRDCLPAHLKSQSLIEHAGVNLSPVIYEKHGPRLGIRIIAQNLDGSAMLRTEERVDGARHPVLWTQADGAQDIIAPAGQVFEPLALSADGTTVGGSLDDAKGQHAVIWTRAGGFKDLGVGGMFARVSALSRDGTVAIGDHEGPTGSGVFRWTRAGGAHDIVREATLISVSADGASVEASRFVANQPHLIQWSAVVGERDMGVTAAGKKS